ncbi:MAG: prephenate/arogenate dehydrogenase [Oscillatoriales cyanobacterium RM2_1_1]|nr:prephenate/arogenate dehydrogenase [Oscillatoriales cyanobacterium SM2_3_0]NJO44940.1 prephenate/arogenate dehydrogenase [Oscillatoriales cyanobacterium RM2_1_1]
MKLGIVGLGLIGGSIGLELSAIRHHPAQFADRLAKISQGEPWSNLEILGVSRRQSTGERGVALGIVDTASTELNSLTDADLIAICTPIGSIVSTVEQLVPYLKPNTVITDVGSVKQPIIDAIAPLWPNFIGGHPMAGTADQGIEAALLNLFLDKPYVLTPTPHTSPQAINQVSGLIHLLGARLIQCSPADHDQAVAWISHVPVMVSAGLITAIQMESDASVLQLAYQLASSGFRDTSRVGGGNPELGTMMAQYNSPAIARALRLYRQMLDQILNAIEQQNWPAIETILTQAQQERQKFNA